MDKIGKIIKKAYQMTKKQWNKYKKQHPNADRSNHTIIDVKQPKMKQDKGMNNKKHNHQKIKFDKKVHQIVTKAKKKHYQKLKQNHPNFQPLVNKEELQKTIKQGKYSVISAGFNPNDKKQESFKKSDPKGFKKFIKQRTQSLRKDLDKLGVKYTEVIGSYDGEQPSFLISHDWETKGAEKPNENISMMVMNDYGDSDDLVKQLNKLGQKYNQDSVAHSDKGKMEWHYTTGERKGKRCQGESTEFNEYATNYFSQARVTSDTFTKWAANMDRCLPWTDDYSQDNFQDNPYK